MRYTTKTKLGNTEIYYSKSLNEYCLSKTDKSSMSLRMARVHLIIFNSNIFYKNAWNKCKIITFVEK